MSKRDPVVKIQIHVPTDVPARASVAALAASNEAGRVVPAYEMHRRAYLTGLRLLEACAECRAGTCDGSKHARRDDERERATIGDLVAVADAAGLEVVVDMKPKSVETTAAEQVGMFFTEPAESKPAPEPKKKARKKREVTEDSPERTRLIHEFYLKYVEARNATPPHTKRDYKAFDELLAMVGFDRASELIKNAFADPFWAGKVTIRDILGNPSKFAGINAAVTVRRSGTTQDEMPEGWA